MRRRDDFVHSPLGAEQSIAANAGPSHARALMRSALSQAILALAESAADSGMSMGALVDTLERNGYAAEDVEREIWTLMSRRRLTPSGFVCRRIRTAGSSGTSTARAYEFLLVPWSPSLDGQLELGLESGS